MHLKRMCILLLFHGHIYIIYRLSLYISGLMFHLRPVLLLIFFLDDLAFDISVMLKSPTIVVLPSVSPLMSVICFIYLGVPMLGANIFIIVTSSSCIGPLIVL